MPLKLAKRNGLGNGMHEMMKDVNDNTLSTIEHVGLLAAIETFFPQNTSIMKKMGVFGAISLAYNLIIDRCQTDQNAGLNR